MQCGATFQCTTWWYTGEGEGEGGELCIDSARLGFIWQR